ncbi:hypothetical protein FRC11_014889, partial [Ceratobasidium sp. 423]
MAELEFHQYGPPGSKSSPKIIISLIDGSKYLLQRRVKHAKGSLVPNFVDTIQNVSPSSVTTLPLIHIKFVGKPDKYPDLLFVLSICYGAQSHGQMDRVARFFIDDDFLALAVILNVTRTRPPSSMASETSDSCSPHDPSPLECLWQEVCYSIQSLEHTFWGHTIADEAKNITRELIYRAARSKIAKYLPQGEIGLSNAASIVARVESIIKKRELSESNIWDGAWNRCWDAVWQNSALDARGSPTIREILPIEYIPGSVHKLTVDGRAPGSIAGRTPERRTLSMDGATWLHSILMGSHPSLIRDMARNSKEKGNDLKPTREDSRNTF